MDRLPKKFAEPIHSSTATALPSPIQFAKNADNVTSKPEPETRVWHLPNPKTRVYKRNPGLETLPIGAPFADEVFSRQEFQVIEEL